MTALPPANARVADALVAAGAGDAAAGLRRLDESTRTAAEAAAALGVPVGAIVKSLVFTADGDPLLVLASGDHLVDTARLAAALGATVVRRADPETVRSATGFAIGGVAPVGQPAAAHGRRHAPFDVPAIVGRSGHARLGLPDALRRVAPGHLGHRPRRRGDVTGPLVTLEVCRVRGGDVPGLVAAGVQTVRERRRDSGVLLAKLLATTGRRFHPRDVQPTRWALLTCRADGEPAPAWRTAADAVESATLHLRPLASRGRWDGRDPFPDRLDAAKYDGPIAVLTRASLRARHVHRFYADVPAIAAEIDAASGMRLAFGFGEAPLLRQGTFSIWESAAALSAFRHDAAAHAAAVRRTPRIGWYAEDLFARLTIVDGTGTVDGIAVAS